MRLHIYNINIDNKFISGTHTNSMHVFLNGFITEAKLKYDVKLYGKVDSKKTFFYNKVLSYIRSKFFLFDIILNQTKKDTYSKGGDLVLVFGYNLLVIIQLIILKFFGFKTICYIFDSHKISTNEKNLKNSLINIYYNLGFYFARFLDVIVCVNSNFKKYYSKLFSNIIESKIGYSNGLLGEYIDLGVMELDCINIVYGGTLNRDNGAHLILELIRKEMPLNLRFIIYGFGDFSNEFEKESKINQNLKFIGKQPNSNIRYLVNKADICIHLRDPNSINKNIAFPSKLIEYLFNSKVVLTNDFPALDYEMKKAMINVCNFSADDIYKFLLAFEKTSDITLNKPSISYALEEIRRDFHWKKVFNDLESKINSTN